MTNARDLTSHLADLLRREHGALADFLVALADFDHRRLWVELGHSSLFYFLHRELALSKGSAHYRKTAAELIQRFPEVVEPLRDGRLCITSIVELAKVMTPENRTEVLPRFFHCSKREAAAVAAAIQPVEAAPHREVVTAVRVPRAAAPTAEVAGAIPCSGEGTSPVQVVEPRGASTAARIDRAQSVHPVELASAPPPVAGNVPQRDSAEPLTAELRRLHVTVSRRFLEKLEAARAAVSHARPGATAEELLEAGLDLVLAQHAKRKGIVEKPRREETPAKPDHVPARVKRAVWTRDGGRCQWPLDAGGICGSTLRVEFDHEVARGCGGPPTIDNLRLLCRFHNDLAARKTYGDAWMDRFTRGRAGGGAGAEALEQCTDG